MLLLFNQIITLLKFITYQTPSKFFQEFEEHSTLLNLRYVKIISAVLLSISSFARILSIIFYDDVLKINTYQELSINNWIQISGCTLFLFLSSYALKNIKSIKSIKYQKIIALVFIAYFLTISFTVSYIISLYNTKNTLVVFLIGIITVSLFFIIEYRKLLGIVAYIISVYLISMVFPDIPVQQKIINSVAAFILGAMLFSFSRYSYYFKSSHFIQIKELEEKNMEIVRLNTQKGEILSFVAHDLRAPINNIEALSNLMLIDNEHNGEAKMIVNSATQAKSIINDLIEAAKQDNNDLPTEYISLNAFVQRLVAKWEVNTDRKIRLSMGKEHLFLKVNPSKLERVIDNLISNAFKFSSIYKPIDITITKNDDKAIIKVADFGIGIPQHLQAHIFEQFSIAGRQGLQGEKSIGLGLHISYKIIEQHHGELSVESRENEGTTFTIQLPLVSA